MEKWALSPMSGIVWNVKYWKRGEGSCGESLGNALNPKIPQRRSTDLDFSSKMAFLRAQILQHRKHWHLNSRTGLLVEASSSGVSLDPQSHLYSPTTVVETAKFRHLRKGDSVLMVCSCFYWRGEKVAIETCKSIRKSCGFLHLFPYLLSPTISPKSFPWSHCPCPCLSKSHLHVKGSIPPSPGSLTWPLESKMNHPGT